MRAISISVVFAAFISLYAFPQALQKTTKVRVPDAAAAIKIAEPLLVKTYGRRTIDAEMPLHAALRGGAWIVTGTLWCDDGAGGRTSEPGKCVGGTAQLKLRQKDGKVLSIIHFK